MQFLGFRLYAPLAAFGDVAVGERRPSLSAPTRTMVLGVVAACLGLTRDQADELAALDRSFGVATRTDSPGHVLVDYHTGQAPDQTRVKAWRKRSGRPPATRREELSATFDASGEFHDLDTQLSQREYRTDASFAVVVWKKEESPWSLEEIAARLREPIFTPYAGRKSAAFAMPFEPTIVEEAPNPVEALRGLSFALDEALAPLYSRSPGRTFRWEGTWDNIPKQRTELRRDQVRSRARWQFEPREEHVWTELPTREA